MVCQAQALWSHHDGKVTPEFIQERQLMHVSVISVCSFVGRLLSGMLGHKLYGHPTPNGTLKASDQISLSRNCT